MKSDIKALKAKIFYFAVIVSLLGHSIDAFLLNNSRIEILADYATLGLTILALYLAKFTNISKNKANGLIIYSIFLNIIISLFAECYDSNIDSIFLQVSLVYGILIFYAGFTINKIHLNVIGSLYIIGYVFLAFYSNDEILVSNMPLIVLLLAVYVIGVNIIINMLNNYNKNQQELIESLTRSNSMLQEQGNELKKINETKDKLLSIIGHDLKTPASSIMGFSDLIARESEKMQSPTLKEYSKYIYQSANRLSIFLSQILDWARIQSGKREAHFQLFNTNEAIKEVVDLMHGTIYLKKLDVQVLTIENINIKADKQMFLTLVRNLVTNALKYTPKNGTIKIDSKVDELNYQFIINDSGIGIEQFKLDKLFLSEMIESSPGTENEKGTGLGMTICKEYILLHNGKIWAESISGHGSTFYFTIPLNL